MKEKLMSPKLTISIPTWNRAEFLKTNVLSIIAAIQKAATDQVEIFISDNASTDDTENFLQAIVQQYSFVRYIRQVHNQGANANFYTVLKEAHGDYIWLLGDDDQIHEDCINRILNDIEHYQPAVLIGGTENDKTGERVYLSQIKTHTLTDQNILLDYDGFILAGKMSVLIYEKSALTQVLTQGWSLIQSLNTPWPHLIWLFQILARGHQLLILPYTTNYIVEKNRYNLLQCGVVRIDLMFIEYTIMVKSLLSEFTSPIQEGILRRLVEGREGELAKILAYATFLNSYFETLRNAWSAFKILPLRQNRVRFALFYLVPALLPKWLRYGFFISMVKLCPNWDAYQDFIVYLKNVKILKKSADARTVFNKAYLK